MTSLVVLGDVHGNARALRAALAQAAGGRMDQLVLLGDLLTYGHDVVETLDLVAEAQARHGAILLTGNHDQLYVDLARGERAYADKLPDWIRESVDVTLARLDLARFVSGLRWQTEHVVEGALFSHANPFAAGDWSYLNHAPDVARAAEAVAARGLSLGVFGHTHRPMWNGAAVAAGHVATTTRDEPIVANAGAVGQPRDGSGQALLLRLELGPDLATAAFEAVAYDVAAHIAALDHVGLSATTRDRLAAFFTAR